MKFPADNIIFDFDGTLVDAIADLTWAVNGMCRKLGLPERDPERVKTWVGNGARKLVVRAIANDIDGDADADLVERGRQLLVDLYATHCCVDTYVYGGVFDALEELRKRGKRMAIVTNKPTAFAEEIAKHYKLDAYIERVFGSDTLPQKKPEPEPLWHAAGLLGGGRSVMVGDSVSDVRAARNADFPVICLSYGFNHGVDIQEADPDVVIDNMRELPALIT